MLWRFATLPMLQRPEVRHTPWPSLRQRRHEVQRRDCTRLGREDFLCLSARAHPFENLSSLAFARHFLLLLCARSSAYCMCCEFVT
jgi:hypothetical protein